MNGEDSKNVFRVTVRGRFSELTDRARRHLVESLSDHDIFKSGYTAEGTFTYTAGIDFFNFRYELRRGGPDAAEAASADGLRETERFLDTMGFGYRSLKVDVVDMSAMWNEAQQRG